MSRDQEYQSKSCSTAQLQIESVTVVGAPYAAPYGHASMATMIASYAKAVAQLPDPKLAKIVLIGLVATVILYVLVYLAVGWTAHHILYRVDIFGWHPLTLFSEILGGVAIFI